MKIFDLAKLNVFNRESMNAGEGGGFLFPLRVLVVVRNHGDERGGADLHMGGDCGRGANSPRC